MTEKIDAFSLTQQQFEREFRTIGWREHFAREKAIEDAYLARFLDRNPDLNQSRPSRPRPLVKTHTDIALREKQDQSAAGEYLRRNFPNHAD